MFRSVVLVPMENKGLYFKLHCDRDDIVHVCNKSSHANSLTFSCVVFKKLIFALRQFFLQKVSSRLDVLMLSLL